MKRLLLLTTFVSASLDLQAQLPIHFGPKLGLNFNQVKLEGGDIQGIESNRQAGFVAGGFVRLELGKISLQPELLFSVKKTEYTEDNSTISVKVSDLDIPLMIGYDLIDLKLVKLRLLGGPVASFNLDENGLKDLTNSTTDELTEKARFGYQAGLSLDITKLTFDIRYQGSFGDTFEFANTTLQGTDSKTNLVQATIGFKIL